MLPQKVWFGNQKCNCTCHERHYKHEDNRECCIVCAYCKIKILAEYYSIHLKCHEAYEKLGVKK